MSPQHRPPIPLGSQHPFSGVLFVADRSIGRGRLLLACYLLMQLLGPPIGGDSHLHASLATQARSSE